MISKDRMNEHDWADWPEAKSVQGDAFTETPRTNGEPTRNDPRSCKTLLRVAASQLRRLRDDDQPHPDDGNPVRDLRKFVERDMGDRPATPDHHPTGTVSQVNHD